MPVSSKRKEYEHFLDRWCLVRDVIKSDAKKYIHDVDITDKARCKKYRNDAILTNFTSRTKSGLLGAVFRKEMLIELPKSLEYLRDDATGYKMSLNKLAQECVGEILESGRYGLLVDYPSSDRDLTAKQIEDMNLKARIYRYKAESIINWETRLINGNPILTLVVLLETNNKLGDDGFEWVEDINYRVLRLEKGVYIQQIYNKDEELVSTVVPSDAEGNPWDEIPFLFVGAEDNDSDIDTIPLYDLAQLNIGHLKNSADYEESVHIVGQPTLIISTDMSQEAFKEANPGGVKIGSRRGQNLGYGGKAEFLQANPNQLADEAMKRKEEQAVMIGARLIAVQADRETAEAARMRHSGECSILSMIASNVQDALYDCCVYVVKFMGKESDISQIDLQINQIFFDKNIDPNLIMAQIQLLDKGILAKKDVRHLLRQNNVIEEERTDAMIDAEATVLEITAPTVNSDKKT